MPRYQVTEEGSRAIAGSEVVQTGLQPLFDGDFNTPDDWASATQQHMRDLALAQAEGAGNIPQLSDNYLPKDWDYKVAELGPYKEPLPSKAVGWLPTGKPDFGGGFSGVLESAWYSLYEKPRGDIELRDIGAFGETATALRDDLRARLAEDVAEEDVGRAFLGIAGSVLGAGIQYIKDVWAFNEDNETIFGKAAQFIGAGFDLAAGSAEELAKVVERGTLGRHILASDELIRRGIERGAIPEGEEKWLETFRSLGAFGALGAVAMAGRMRLFYGNNLVDERDYLAAVDRNRDAARMAYTGWFDPAAKEEYMRRWRGGEDPRLLALELENPGAEMVGRIIFDPLNAFDLLQVGSLATKLLRVRRATRELTAVADPALGKALDVLAAADETNISAATRGVLDAIGPAYDATRQSRVEVAGRRGLFRQTAFGKRATYGQRANNFMATIIGVSGDDPDLANSVWRGLVMAADPEINNRAMGLTILAQAMADSKGALTPGVLFSQSANETALLLRNLLLDDAGDFNPNVLLRMLEDAGDDPEKLARLLDAKLNDALAKDFPTIQEQVRLNEEWVELDGEEAARFLERNPLANQDPGVFYKSLAKADEGLQPIYQKMGEFQSRLFMGMAPASWRYRANNRWGNFVPTLVDVGPEPAIKGILKGLPGIGDYIGPQRSMDETARHLGGVLPEGAVRGLGPARSFRGGQSLDEAKGDWLEDFTTAGLRGAADDEAANAAHVVAKSVRRSAKSYMKAERRIIDKELAGLSAEQRRLVIAAMRENYYNVDDALDALRSEEGYDISRNLAFLNDDEIEELRELRLYDLAIQAARENDGLDDVLRRIDEIVEGQRQIGMEAGSETPFTSLDDVPGQNIARHASAIEEGEGLREADMFQRRVHEIREFNRLYDDALFGDTGLQRMATEQIMRNSLIEGARTGMTDDQKVKMAMAQLDGVAGPIQQEIRTATDTTFESADDFLGSTRELTEGSKGRRTGDQWLTRRWAEHDAAAKQFGLPGLGPPPKQLTARQLRDAVWQHETSGYRQVQNARWTQLREQNADRYRAVAQRLAGAAGIEDFHTPSVNAAEAQLIRSRMMDRAVVLPDGRMVVNFSADQAGITDLVESVAGNLGVRVNPEIHVGLIERVDPITGETGLGLASIDELPDGGAQITLSDELLKQDIGTIKESLGHELSHLFEDTEDGARILGEQYGGDFELFARDILYQTGLQRRTAPTAARADALREMLEANPDIGASIGAMRDLEKSGDNLRLPVVGTMDDAAPTPFRVFHETQPAALDAAERLKQGLRDNWGQTGRMGALDPETEAALSGWAQGARGRVTEFRAQAISVANQTRDFILHNYPVRYGADLVAGYIWPYQFWHSRTYAKWMGRMIQHPGMTAAYSHYRKALEKQHAGLPAWWRRNINVTDLLGIETDSPLWFNLERTLNPIQGLTGVDFSDPRRRLDNWSATLEDINKFGPSVWMPYQVALALKYQIDGEDEAASRWAGRLWSPTGAFRDLTALIDPEGQGVELDPFIHLFGGGVGPWERGRIGRQFGAMQTEGKYGQADLVDAARLQEGPIWEEARARAINQRAPNVPAIAAPFFLGGGFKLRTESDTQIDMFYAEMYGLMRVKEDLNPEEYRQAWNDLEQRYPFMEVLLLSKRSGLDRDEALAWSVLDRIPPAMTDDIAELVGINPDIIGIFHENNGSLEKMTEADRLQFMGAVLEMAAILDVPDNATKAEWQTARTMYREMRSAGEEQFSDDIWERVDAWYAVYDPENMDAADAMMERDPSIQQALDWQQRMIMTTPLLGAYYTSEERIRKFYKGQMYDAAEAIFGDDLWDHFSVYNELKDAGEREAAKQYWEDHPQLEGYVNLRDQTLPDIEAKVARIGFILPEAVEPVFRDREEADLPDGPPEPTSEDWINAQVLAYATGQQQDDAPEDVRRFIREQADNQWPGTRSLADRYYDTDDPERAREILLESSALAARVAWESEALRQLELVQAGRFAETGAQPTPPAMSSQRWQQMLGPAAYNLTLDALEGDELPLIARNKLDEIAAQLGLGDWQDVVERVGQAAGIELEEEPAPPEEAGIQVDRELQRALGNLEQTALAQPPGGERRPPRPWGGARFEQALTEMDTDDAIQTMREFMPGLRDWIFDAVGPSVANRDIEEIAAGFAHVDLRNVRVGQRFARQLVPRLIEIAHQGNIGTLLHEMAHQLDTVGVGRRLSESASFKKAIRDLLEDPTMRTAAEEAIVRLVRDFPGIAGNEMYDAPTGPWGGNIELFASIMAASRGNLANIPEPLRPFYSRFMQEVPRDIIGPAQVVPFGAGDELETLLGERTARIIGENLSVSQRSGDLGISDEGLEAVRQRARELGLDEDKAVEDVLRILRIDF